MPDYKMAYHLNRHLGVRFNKVLPEIWVEENGTSYFRSFEYEDEKNHLIWRLFENKSNHTETDNKMANALLKQTMRL